MIKRERMTSAVVGVLLGLSGANAFSSERSAFLQVERLDDLLPIGACIGSDKIECEKLRTKLRDLWPDIKEEPRSGGRYAQQLRRLEFNMALEKYDFLAGESQQDRSEDDYIDSYQAIENKYNQLASLLTRGRRDGGAAVTDPAVRTSNIAYHYLEFDAVRKVSNRFGKLEIRPHEISSFVDVDVQSDEVSAPWAGYWYPKYNSVLYDGGDSVLAKFDRMMGQAEIETHAQRYEREASSSYIPDSWEGLCNAWSVASVMTVEPQGAKTLLGEDLTITDQKALLTKMYENYPVDIYGVRYDGDRRTDGTFQDIRPEAFHKLLQAMLHRRQQPLIVDDTPGIEVWQQPVFRVDWAMAPDLDKPYAYVVTARVWQVKPRWQLVNRTTSASDYAVTEYSYRLYVDSQLYEQAGRLLVIAGEWVNGSLDDHPDYIVIPQEGRRPASFNPWIDQNVDYLNFQ
jgi:hypothetical protein